MLLGSICTRSCIAGFIACVLITAAVAFHSFRHPYNNWDEIGYVGSAISWSVASPQDVQTRTFAYLREALPDTVFRQDISDQNRYRSSVYRDATTFSLQYPFYKVKALYVVPIWLSWKFGFNPLRATSVISTIAAACLGLIVSAILVRRLGLIAVVAYSVILILG